MGSLSLFVLAVIIFGICAYMIYILIRARISPLRKELPGRELWNPLFGNLLEDAHIPFFERWVLHMNSWGRIYRYYTFLGTEWVVLLDPDSVKKVTLDNSANYFRGPLIGTGAFEQVVGSTSLLITKGELHRKHRALVSPAFRIGNLRRLFPTMLASTQRLISHWKKLLDQAEGGRLDLDIRHHMSRLTLTVIGRTSFGYDFNCIEDENSPVARALEQIIGVGSEARIWHFVPYAYYLPVPRIRKMWEGIRMVQGLFDKMIAHGDVGSGDSLLNMVIKETKEAEFSARELRDELMTIILAGHETSSLAITWALWLLSKDPAVQERARKEALGVEEELSWESLDSLSYVKAVIHETLRLFPPIPFFTRTSHNTAVLGGYRIPAGTPHVIHVGQMQRLPDVWSEPEAFRPERFLEDSVPWDAWMPFGEGTHKCIGFKFALLEISCALTLLLRHFKFSLDPRNDNLKLQIVITMQPVGPLMLTVERL